VGPLRSGNRIGNVTERAVNIRQLGGRAYIERNVIVTGSVASSGSGVAPDAIQSSDRFLSGGAQLDPVRFGDRSRHPSAWRVC